MAGQVRELVSGYDLQEYRVLEGRFEAAAVCEIDVELRIDGDLLPGRMRWVLETEDGSSPLLSATAEWFLYSWGPEAILARAGAPIQTPTEPEGT